VENYIIITWPDSQKFMDLDGFEENSILINDDRGIDEYGPCAFLINRDWFELNK